MVRTLVLPVALALLAGCGRAAAPPADPAPPSRPAPVAAEPASNTVPLAADSATDQAEDASAASDVVPRAFQGEWNADLARCGTDLGEMRLTLTSDRIGFYESGGPILDAVQEDELTVLLRARLTGEGETWQRRVRLRLSEDGRTLTDISGERPVIRHRCPARP